MKVQFKNILKAYSGKCDGLVYFYNPRLHRVLCRRHVIPQASPQNRRLAAVSSNLSALNPSPGFITDLRHYAALLPQQGQNWRNVYVKMMYALSRLYNVDLAVLTREQIEQLSLPCNSVKAAIEAGLLVPVKGYENYTSGL